MPAFLAAAIPWIIKGIVALLPKVIGAVKGSNTTAMNQISKNQQQLATGNQRMMAGRNDLQDYLKIMNAFKQY